MNKRVLLNVACSREVQRVSCSVVSTQIPGPSQNLAKRLILATDISLVILWVYLHLWALSWSVSASLRRASMLRISSRIPLRVLSSGSLALVGISVASGKCWVPSPRLFKGVLGWLCQGL